MPLSITAAFGSKRHSQTTPGERLDKPVRLRSPLREIHGNITVSQRFLTAWYVLGEQRWSFATNNQRESGIYAYAARLASLTGRRCHLRVIDRPYPAYEWAKALYENTEAPLPGFNDRLAAAQHAMLSSNLDDKVVLIGVQLPVSRTVSKRMSASARGCEGALPEIAKIEREIERIGAILRQPGAEGRPARLDEIEWATYRSVRFSLPDIASRVPRLDEPWDYEDIPSLYEGVRWDYEPFAPTVRVSAMVNGAMTTRHAAVLTLGRVRGLDIPQTDADPWMQSTDRLGFPVEWSAIFDIKSGEEAAKDTQKKRLAIRDQQRHHAQHEMEEPLNLQRNAEHARRIEDETLDGAPVVATRAYGWWRLAVSGATQEECLDRVEALQTHYLDEHSMVLHHPYAWTDAASQFNLLREFEPGQTVRETAHKRRLPTLYAAAAMPHVSARVGDRRGGLIGYTSSNGQRAVLVDPFYAMEELDQSGTVPIVGTLGSGKSVLIGTQVDEVVTRGILTTVVEPGKTLAGLVDLYPGHARHLDVIGGEEGLLSPYAVIADPLRDNYATEDEWRTQMTYAAQNRKALAVDVIVGLLPAAVLGNPDTHPLIMGAVREVGGERTASLRDVITALGRNRTKQAKVVADYLRDAAEMPTSRLFFPNHVRDLPPVSTDTLLVITMHGLVLPDDSLDRNLWSSAERASVPVLHLATHYATQRSYSADREQRKFLALDEAGKIAKWASGRALFNNLARDSRKWNLASYIAGQNPADILGLDLANLVSQGFAGRIEDEETASSALRLLRVGTGVGYEGVMGTLSPVMTMPDGNRRRGPREFIYRDADGNVERMVVSLDHKPHVLEALDNTPVGMRRAS